MRPADRGEQQQAGAERPLYALAIACTDRVRRSAMGRDESVEAVPSASGSSRPEADIDGWSPTVSGDNPKRPTLEYTRCRLIQLTGTIW